MDHGDLPDAPSPPSPPSLPDVENEARKASKDKAREDRPKTAEERRKFSRAIGGQICRLLRQSIHANPYKVLDKAQAEKRMADAERARLSVKKVELSATGIQPADYILRETLDEQKQDDDENRADTPPAGNQAPEQDSRDWFVRMSNTPELIMELAKHLCMPSLLTLYSISRPFNDVLNGHLSHAMRACAAHQALESSRIYVFTLYETLCRPDPVGRPHPKNVDAVRKVPGLRWLQMVVHREKVIRDILASMARQGHRMPTEMALSLKKMWLVMDIATSARRVQVMHSAKYFTALDLFNIQMFVVKLDMRFNDPIDGPADDHLRKLMLGQRGLTPLCRMLKREKVFDEMDVVKLAVKYDWVPPEDLRHLSVFGIPCEEVGTGHLEGWGKGHVHLYRPDELVVRESVRRGLDLKNHIMGMMLWGYVDPITGQDTPATDEEKYMSDEGEKPEHPLKQDYDWLEIEPKVYKETEELRESNDPKYALQKRKERAKVKDEQKAEARRKALDQHKMGIPVRSRRRKAPVATSFGGVIEGGPKDGDDKPVGPQSFETEHLVVTFED
ncbi:hypothetical protein QTJ16_006993 [Diplocarpon rosae]|uniref:Uncharacterized protein n=1 Tax=Diplocarpon rosae TaxID=946125 RepID=A0AAD9SVM1_9HELO|nr:hypothetical protein QTJ16_006993 [Diplocarpon rosae]